MAIAECGIRADVLEYGRIANTATALDRLMRKLGDGGVGLRFRYEAEPCRLWHSPSGVDARPRMRRRSFSLIPRRAGDRIKTDRWDAASLARLHRAGELTAVWAPEVGHEAMRGLVRARLDAVLRRARPDSGVFAPPGLPLRRGNLDQAASPLAGGSQVRAGDAYRLCARRSHLGGRSCRGSTQPADGASRDAAGLDVGPGGRGAANNAVGRFPKRKNPGRAA